MEKYKTHYFNTRQRITPGKTQFRSIECVISPNDIQRVWQWMTSGGESYVMITNNGGRFHKFRLRLAVLLHKPCHLPIGHKTFDASMTNLVYSLMVCIRRLSPSAVVILTMSHMCV